MPGWGSRRKALKPGCLETTEGKVSVRKALFLAVVCLGLVACLPLTLRVVSPPPATFPGHTGRIIAVIASQDGKALASMSEDKTIKLWDVVTRKERATLRGSNATFSSDGKTLAWTEGRTIKLWDVTTGKERVTLRGHRENVCSVAFSPDGTTLASASSDTTLKLWDATTGKERATYRGHTSSLDPVIFSPDGKTLALGGYGPNAAIKLWDVATGKERATLRVTGWSAESLAFTPDGKTLASGGGSVRLWDVAAGTNTATLDTPGDGAEGLVFSPDGKTLAAVGSGSPEVYLWDAATGKQTATWEKSCRRPRPRLLRSIWDAFPDIFEEHTYVPLSVLFTADGKMVALGFDNRDDTTLALWQVAAATSVRK
jgi:WD40 repeat protein